MHLYLEIDGIMHNYKKLSSKLESNPPIFGE
jgi:hypothetical protein